MLLDLLFGRLPPPEPPQMPPVTPPPEIKPNPAYDSFHSELSALIQKYGIDCMLIGVGKTNAEKKEVDASVAVFGERDSWKALGRILSAKMIQEMGLKPVSMDGTVNQ